MVKRFKDYVMDQEREYNVRVKTIVPIGDEEIAVIEQVMQKYVLVDITKPKKTILQNNPLDFYDYNNVEVYIIDITTKLPLSSYVVLQELKLALNIPEKSIVVRGVNDPLETYTQQIVAGEEAEELAIKNNLESGARLSTKSDYDSDELGISEEPMYGNEYNKKFLDTLSKIAKEREARLAQPKLEKSDETIEDGRAFNKDHSDAPEPKYSFYAETLKNLRKHPSAGQAKLSTVGNYDDNEVKASRKYNKYGKDGESVAVVTITNTKPGIRKVYD